MGDMCKLLVCGLHTFSYTDFVVPNLRFGMTGPSWHPPQSHLLRRYDWRGLGFLYLHRLASIGVLELWGPCFTADSEGEHLGTGQ